MLRKSPLLKKKRKEIKTRSLIWDFFTKDMYLFFSLFFYEEYTKTRLLEAFPSAKYTILIFDIRQLFTLLFSRRFHIVQGKCSWMYLRVSIWLCSHRTLTTLPPRWVYISKQFWMRNTLLFEKTVQICFSINQRFHRIPNQFPRKGDSNTTIK